MGRPIQADSDATRRRILESASGAFASGSNDECSMRAIAKGAGVTAAMLHHYYGSKDDLFEACIDAMYMNLRSLRDEFFVAIGTQSDASAIVDKTVRTAFRFARREQTSVRLLMRQVLMAGTLDATRRETMQAPFLAAVTGYLAGATGRSEADLRLAVQSVNMLVARYSVSTIDELRFFLGRSEATDEDVLRAVEEHLVRASRALLAI
jgi:AcrR family transcriptional regulator